MGHQQQEINVRFGREVSRLRRIARYTQARLAKEVGVSHGHIGNVENGKRTPDLRLVADLDRVLHAEGRLERLWATLTGDGEPVWLDDLEEVERRATSIMETHTVLFPALLQTENYARAAVQTFSPWFTPDEVESSVKSRMMRANRFVESATLYRAVLDTSVLERHPDNDHKLMSEQLAHIVGLIENGRISIQLVNAGWHRGLVGTFTLIASLSAPEVVYVESAHSGRLIDDAQDVQRFRVLLSDVQAVAVSPRESFRLIREEMERLNHG